MTRGLHFLYPCILNLFIVHAPGPPTLLFECYFSGSLKKQHLRWTNPLPICQSQGTFNSSLCSIIALQMERKWTWWARLWGILLLFSHQLCTNHAATNWMSKLPLGHAEASLIRQTGVYPDASCPRWPAGVSVPVGMGEAKPPTDLHTHAVCLWPVFFLA